MILGATAPLHAGEEAKLMQVAICPRLVPEPDGGDEETFVRRVEELFVSRTDEWKQVSENISHFKFYSTPVAWMAKKAGFLAYAPVAIRLVPDKYMGDTEQGWWDDAHWRKFGHYKPPYETSEKFCQAVLERGGLPFTYVQAGMPSDDYARAFPGHMMRKDISELDKKHRHHLPYVSFDDTDRGFREHLDKVWGNLRQAGLKGVMFDYPESAWRSEGGFGRGIQGRRQAGLERSAERRCRPDSPDRRKRGCPREGKIRLIMSARILIPFVLACSMLAAAQEPLKPLERVEVQQADDGARFALAQSGAPFFVKGFNYVRLRGDHATFDADTETTKAHYDPERAEAMFKALGREGYNTVRVFIIGRSKANPGIAGNFETTQALHEPYMENVLDFLRRATRHGIRVFPTFGDGGIPINAYYRLRDIRGNGHNKNALILTREGIDARVEHIASFLTHLKEKEPKLLPTLLGLQCQNEAYLRADQWPFTLKEGAFTAANGKTYDMASTEQRQAMMDEGYRHYHDKVVAAVKAIDPQMLVAEGVFVPRAVGKDPKDHAGVWPGKTRDERYPPTLTTLGTGALDFLDVHFYRTNKKESVDEAFRLNLASTGFFTPEMAEIRKQKPVIMGEFGAFDHVEETFGEAVDSMVRVRDLALEAGLNGMLFWTYDSFEQPRLYHAASDWPLFVKKMSDFEKSDSNVLVGVNYFAGWWKELPNKWHGQGWKIGQPDWRPDYPERVPLLGEYNDQATMDREIEAAASHGVDFFAILWYFPKPGGRETQHAPRLNRGLETFLASPKAVRLSFFIEYCNTPNFSAVGDEQWAECIPIWVEAMKHPSYLRVDGRLVFKVHGVTEFLKANDHDLELCQKRLDTLREAVRDAGLGEMIIGVGLSGQTPSLGAKWPPAQLFDFTATYMGVPKVEVRKADHPYATLAAQARTTLESRVKDPLPWMPYLAAGWNPRPWTYPKAAPHYQRFFTLPTRAEFTAELQAMREALAKHPSLGLPRKDGTTQKAFTIYAWNEFGEGGIVAPTKGNGTMMLETINDVFGEQE